MQIDDEDEGKEKVFAANGMLNKPGFNSTGAFSYRIEVQTAEITKNTHSVGYSDAEFHINGCGRDHVTLDCSVFNEDGFENSLYKIDTLMGALLEFRKDLIEAREIIKDRKAQLKKIQEEKKKEKENEETNKREDNS